MRAFRRVIAIRVFGVLGLAVLALGATQSGAQGTAAFPGSTAVGVTSAPITATVTLTTGGVPATERVVTQTLANGDFALVSSGTCGLGMSYSAGQQCTVTVSFTPTAPGPRMGAVELFDGNGVLLGETNLGGVGTGPLAVLDPGNMNTLAGDGAWIYTGDNVQAIKAPIFLPTGVVVDARGDIYLSDSNNNRVRRVDGVDTIITTVAGTGTSGYSGDGGPAVQAEVSDPGGLVLDGAGNLYFADTGNQVVRRIDAVTGIITTVAGIGGSQGYSGDGGAATSAKLAFPEGVTFDAAGNMYIADTSNNVIRKVSTTGIITTYAGTGTAGYNGDGISATTAALNTPWSVSFGADGSLYIADLTNNRVRQVTTAGTIRTVAGAGGAGFTGDGGAATTALLNAPAAAVLDPAGNLYIADSGNNRVRKVYGDGANQGEIVTIAGNGSEQFLGDGGPATGAGLYGPYSLTLDAGGDIFIADLFHNRIRVVYASQISLMYATIRVGKVSPPQPVMLANDGNAALHLSQYVLNQGALDAGTTTCAIGAALAVGIDCNLGAEFAPTMTGAMVNGSITLDSDASDTAPVINLSGQVLSVNPTSIALSSSANPSLVGASVTFTATVTDSSTFTGTVAFYDGTTQLCNVTLSTATATCTLSTLTLGTHSITAVYSGDSQNAAATSTALSQVVKQQPTVTLTASPNPAVVTTNVTMTVAVTAPTGTPSGTVVFYDGNTALGNATLTNGTASYSTTTLTVGTHPLTAQYSGDTSNIAGGSQPPLNEVIQEGNTTTVLTSSNANVTLGTPVTFTVTVTGAGGAPTPTGTVQINDAGNNLGTATLNANGTASLTTSAMPPGVQTITAVYSGDSNNGPSQSAGLTETVNQITTSTSLTANPNPLSAGSTVQLTATVTAAPGSSGGGAVTGNVTFSEGTTTLGVVAVGANGVAVLNLSTLTVGSHTIIATYAGSTNYSGSTSPAIVEVVQQTGTTTTLSSAATTTLAGEPAVFTSTVTSSTGVPTGSVSFFDGIKSIGTAPLNAQGVATFSTSTLAVGTHSITAVYSGDGYYTTSTSAALQQTVVLATTSLTISAPTAPVNAGVAFTVNTTLTSNGVAPTGSVSLRDGSTVIAQQTVSADGTFSFSGLILSVGSHSLSTMYSGDANNAAATSAVVVVVVQQGPSTETLTTSASPSTQGQSVTFTATITSPSPNPTGTVTFLDGTTVIASVPLGAAGVATYSTNSLTVGTHQISATYAGDTNHAASNTASLSELIVQASMATLQSSLNPSAAGNNVTFTAKITGTSTVVPTGTVVFKDGSTVLGTATLDGTGSATYSTTTLAVGSHSMSVTYSGDSNYYASTASLTQTVQNSSTQIALTASSNPVAYGASETFTATIVTNGGVATGNVTFTDGGTTLGTGVLNGSGVATLSTSSLTPGSHSIVANYAGDGKASASSSTPLTITVVETTAVALTSSANPTQTLTAIVLTAQVSNANVGTPTGSVTFTDGAVTLGTAMLNAAGTATLNVTQLTAGSHSIIASYGGDADNAPGASPALTETVTLRPTTTTLTYTTSNPANPQEVTLIGVVASTGPVTPTGTITFTSGTLVLGTGAVNSSGVATLTVVVNSGTTSVVASYGGDASYAASKSTPTVVSGGAATQFTLLVNPTAMTLATKQHGTAAVTVASVSGYTDTMEFGCLGLPVDATCTFTTSTSMLLPANGTINLQLTVDTGNPLGAGATAHNTGMGSPTVLLCLLPAGLLLGFGLRRKGRRGMLPALLAVCAVLLTLSASGCGGLTVNSTPPGTYNFKVTASGQGTGVTESQTMTLTVTQ